MKTTRPQPSIVAAIEGASVGAREAAARLFSKQFAAQDENRGVYVHHAALAGRSEVANCRPLSQKNWRSEAERATQ